MTCWSVLAIVAVVTLAVATRARADVPQADEPLVAVIVVGDGPRAAELAARVDGQVSDLDVALVRVDDPRWGATAGDDPLGAATRLARARGARVVVWFQPDGAAWTVHVAEPGAGRLLSRRVDAQGDLAGSASAEAVALVVRAALAAIAEGGSIGVEPAAPAVDAAVEAQPPMAPRTTRRTYAALGWSGIAGGVGPAVQHGVSGRLGAVAGGWRAGVTLAAHPAITVDEPGATMELSRGALGVLVARDVVHAGGGWALSLELGASATRFARVTTSADAPRMPTPPAVTWAPTVSASLRAARRIAGGTWLELSAGVDALLRVPAFALAAPGGLDTYAKMAPVQPQASLGLVLDLP